MTDDKLLAGFMDLRERIQARTYWVCNSAERFNKADAKLVEKIMSYLEGAEIGESAREDIHELAVLRNEDYTDFVTAVNDLILDIESLFKWLKTAEGEENE